MRALSWIILAIVVVVLVGGIIYYSGNSYKAPQTPLNLNTTPNINNLVPENPNLNTTTTTPTTTSSSPETYQVDIQNFAFSPSSLTIKVGDKVTWTNNDPTPHTVTSDSGSELGSSSLSTSQTYSHTFNTKGEFDYHCSIHTMMKGKVIVQ